MKRISCLQYKHSSGRENKMYWHLTPNMQKMKEEIEEAAKGCSTLTFTLLLFMSLTLKQ